MNGYNIVAAQPAPDNVYVCMRLITKGQFFIPLDVVEVGGTMIYNCAVRLFRRHLAAVVVIMLDLLRCRPAEDVWRLVQRKWRFISLHLTAAAVVNLEH